MAEDQNKANAENIEKFNKSAQEAAGRIDTLKGKLGGLAKASETVGNGFDGFLFSANKLQSTLSNNADALEKIKSGQMGINEAEKLQQEIASQTADLQGRKEQLQKKLLGSSSKLTDAQKVEAKVALTGINKRINASKNLGNELLKATGGGTKFGKAMAQSKSTFSKILGDTKKANAGIGDFSKSFMSMGKKGGAGFIATLMKGVKLMKLLKSLNPLGALIGIMTAVVKGMIKANNAAADLGRQMGLTSADAGLVRTYFIDISNSMRRINGSNSKFFATLEDIQGANQGINKLLGTQAVFSEEILRSTAEEAKFLGISLQTSSKLAQRAIALDKTRKSITNETIKGVQAAREELGVRMDFRPVLEEIANTTGRIRAAFADNTEEFARSITKAKALGMTLGQVSNASRKLLDFQSSISAEMEAELFLSRDLNLDQARLAAMTQDYAGFMDAITENAGSYLEFTKMNVFQQDKLAAALGMSADKLEEMLFTNLTMSELQQEIANASSEEERNRAMQLSLQMKFNQEMEKLQIIFINIMTRLTAMFEKGTVPRILKFFGFKDGEGKQLLDTKDIYGDVDETKTLGRVQEIQAVGGVDNDGREDLAKMFNMSVEELNRTLKDQQNLNINVNNSMDYDGFNAGPAASTSIDRTSTRYNTTFYGPKF